MTTASKYLLPPRLPDCNWTSRRLLGKKYGEWLLTANVQSIAIRASDRCGAQKETTEVAADHGSSLGADHKNPQPAIRTYKLSVKARLTALLRNFRPKRKSRQKRALHSAGRTESVGKSPVNVGRFTYGFENITIRQWGEGSALTIGAFCSIASSVTVFLGGNHRVDWATTFPFGHIFVDELGGTSIQGHPATNGDVVIGNDVWIGHGSTIMSGVSIGNGAVIAANSNVVKDVMPYEIVGGNPAKVIKIRFRKEIVDLLLTLEWWNLPVDVIKEINKDLSVEPTIDALTILIRQHRA